MKKKKPYLRYLIFLAICGLFYIVLKDSLGDIWAQVCSTKWTILVAITIAAILYHAMEGRITYLLARRHAADYTYLKGLKNSFYASFYRVATLGSAGGVSAIYNLHLDHVPVSEGIGLYFAGYVLHKITILLYSIAVILLRPVWIRTNFGEYKTYFLIGYAIGIATVVILILVCVSPWVYKILHFLLIKLKDRFHKYGRQMDELDLKIVALQRETKALLTDKSLFLQILFDNFIKLSTYYIIPYLILAGTGLLSPIDSLSLVAIIYILAAAIPAPAGVGSIEAVYLILATKFVSQIEAAASMLLFRFSTLLVPCIIGGIYIVFRNIHHTKQSKKLQS